MATHHASAGEVVDLDRWTTDLTVDQTKVIVKTEKFELARLVLPKNKQIPSHKVEGPIIVHCTRGEIEFLIDGIPLLLKSNQLLHLKPGEPHSLKAKADSVILLTILFN
ncbi:MAG: cupin domain-containing protein [Gammaproteobacteria bacterium]